MGTWHVARSTGCPGRPASLLTCVQVHPVAPARKGVSPVSSSPHQAWPVTVAHSPCSPRPLLLPPPALEASFPHCLGTRKRPWQLGAQAGRDCPAAAGRVSTGPPHQAPHLFPILALQGSQPSPLRGEEAVGSPSSWPDLRIPPACRLDTPGVSCPMGHAAQACWLLPGSHISPRPALSGAPRLDPPLLGGDGRVAPSRAELWPCPSG